MNYMKPQPKRQVQRMYGMVNEKTQMTFGKFASWKVEDVPAWWLLWAFDKADWNENGGDTFREQHPGLIAYVEANLKRLEDEYDKDQENLRKEGKGTTARTRKTDVTI